MPLGSNKIGLMAASAGGFEASGGTETTYSSGGVDYKVHTFLSSETFTVTAGGEANLMVVAGGGGGGGTDSSVYRSGGGGAGGGATNIGDFVIPPATPNTGGCGGPGTMSGTAAYRIGSAGGSGIVVIRYTV